jgi:hypothetical protein
MPDKIEKTNCFTYKVELIVQILAKDQHTAALLLDQQGGYTTSRKVTLLDSVSLTNSDEKKESKIKTIV